MKTLKFKIFGKTYFLGNIDEKDTKNSKNKEFTPILKKHICGYGGWCKENPGNNSTGFCNHHHDLTVYGF